MISICVCVWAPTKQQSFNENKIETLQITLFNSNKDEHRTSDSVNQSYSIEISKQGHLTDKNTSLNVSTVVPEYSHSVK